MERDRERLEAAAQAFINVRNAEQVLGNARDALREAERVLKQRGSLDTHKPVVVPLENKTVLVERVNYDDFEYTLVEVLT